MFTLHEDKRRFLFESLSKFSAIDWPFYQQQNAVQQLKANTDVRLKQPPDFSYRLYSLSNPFQKARGKGKRELKPKMTSESMIMQQLSMLMSRLFSPLSEKRDLPPFVPRFPWISSYEAKILFVKNGIYKISMYEGPKPHDYRQYEANLPNFVTSYSRDPLNLKLKSQNLNIDPGLEPLKGKQKNSGQRFVTYKLCENKGDPRLLLPKNPSPPKSASFTVN